MLSDKQRNLDMKVRTICTLEDDLRESRWSLIQYDDGALHVEHHARHHAGRDETRLITINEFMREGGHPAATLQALIDRMFSNA
jgi:hypothetical protein